MLQRKNYRTKGGRCRICLRYTAYRRPTFVGFNVSVHPRDWNENKKQVKATEPRHILYNRLIKEQYHKAESIVLDNYLIPLTAQEFIERFKDKLTELS
ncbi:Arm DNA-binding domain-containing protein [Dysgonomonas reticulitermitis]